MDRLPATTTIHFASTEAREQVCPTMAAVRPNSAKAETCAAIVAAHQLNLHEWLHPDESPCLVIAATERGTERFTHLSNYHYPNIGNFQAMLGTELWTLVGWWGSNTLHVRIKAEVLTEIAKARAAMFENCPSQRDIIPVVFICRDKVVISHLDYAGEVKREIERSAEGLSNFKAREDLGDERLERANIMLSAIKQMAPDVAQIFYDTFNPSWMEVVDLRTPKPKRRNILVAPEPL